MQLAQLNTQARRSIAHGVIAIAVSFAVQIGVFNLGENAGENVAEAYPQFQFSSGTARCNQCHISPGGGGLINGWGRDESADTISRGGNGDFMNGVWEAPDWLSLGADFRFAAGAKDTGAAETDLLLFPMQADIYTSSELSDSLKLVVTVGARGSARNRDFNPQTRFASREHYLLWQPKSRGAYIRAGRFFTPFGLRQPDHTNYVRRRLGYYAWEETYNISGGIIEEDWEVHASAFMPDPYLQSFNGPVGGVLMYERRNSSDTGALGGQYKVEIGEVNKRYIAGAFAKWYSEGARLLLLAEANAMYETFDAAGADARLQWIGHLNATYFVTQGIMLGAVVEHFDEDTSLRGTQRDTGSLQLQYFPKAHWEISALGRYERIGGTGEKATLGLLMVHYYL